MDPATVTAVVGLIASINRLVAHWKTNGELTEDQLEQVARAARASDKVFDDYATRLRDEAGPNSGAAERELARAVFELAGTFAARAGAELGGDE